MIEWTKCASVTYGGKPYFWTTITPKGRHWVIWSRQTLVWEVTCDNQDYPLVQTGFKTPQKAMKFLEASVN
jgi:hypothetical protein